ncbi:hypothetical protein XU18_2224 [Perkinsela sp. CCAP 1560/4]|nr:hypothetical protein XU18_2224 [Perkinsela sp. CCAP 1560/4]|eukprot:KNH07047.1 hypothetical protein XU18_2224 [Perkinsela sp. CCAP 1560/4]
MPEWSWKRGDLRHSDPDTTYWSPKSIWEMGLNEAAEKRGVRTATKGIPVCSRPDAELASNFFTPYGRHIDLSGDVFTLTGYTVSRKFLEYLDTTGYRTVSSTREAIEVIQRTRIILVVYKDFSRYAIKNFMQFVELDEDAHRPVLIRYYAIRLRRNHAPCFLSLSLPDFTARVVCLRIKYGIISEHFPIGEHITTRSGSKRGFHTSFARGKAQTRMHFAWSRTFSHQRAFRTASQVPESNHQESRHSILAMTHSNHESKESVGKLFQDLCVPFLDIDEFCLDAYASVCEVTSSYPERAWKTIRWGYYILREDYPTVRLFIRFFSLVVLTNNVVDCIRALFCRKNC